MATDLKERAEEQIRLAEYFCKKGDHYSAGRHYQDAATIYTQAGDSFHCGFCMGQADAEFKRCRYTPPPNVSGLVD